MERCSSIAPRGLKFSFFASSSAKSLALPSKLGGGAFLIRYPRQACLFSPIFMANAQDKPMGAQFQELEISSNVRGTFSLALA